MDNTTNMNTKTVLIVVGVLALIGIAVAVFAGKNKDNIVSGTNDTTTTVGDALEGTGQIPINTAVTTGGTNKSTTTNSGGTPAKSTISSTGGGTSVNPTPSSALMITNPLGGEILRRDSTVNVTWDTTTDLTKARMVVTLMKDGRELLTLTEKGGVPATDKTFKWKIGDVSIWGEEEFSLKLTTTGLSKNLTAQSGTFTVPKPITQ